MGDDTAPRPPFGEGPSGRPLPLSVRMLGAGVRGARSVGRATGIERAVEAAAEEAMVAAVESEAVERALARVLQGPAVENAVHGALDSETLKRALIDALDSEMVDEVWRRLLASDEAQELVERIAEAPELRDAIRAQSVGLIGDIGRKIGEASRNVDEGAERGARRILFRRPREAPTQNAGAVSRLLAFALDGLIVNLGFSGLAALAALIVSAFSGNPDGVSNVALALGSAAWIGLGCFYLVFFWSLAGQTPGMDFFGIRLGPAGYRLSLRQSLKRLVGIVLSVIPLGLGFLGVLLDERRRGWHDRLSGVDVVYEPEERELAPWSTLAEAAAGAAEKTKAPGSRGLRPQHLSGPPLGG
jgi:uncharacterized RDD family membrane protein YckC